MKIDNRIEKPFVKSAVFVGVVFLITGTLMALNGAIVWGILVVLFAALVVFTFSGIEIDTKKYEVRQYNHWFGLVKTGKWKSLQTYIGVTLMPITLVNQWPADRTALPRTKKLIIAFPWKTKPGNLPLP